MPLEPSNRTRTVASKPLTPALSSNLRTRPAHGLTPRLAGAGITSPSAALPSQRSLRQQTLSPERNADESVLSLNANITPRSGTRSARVETESPSTPDTTARAKSAASNGNIEDVVSTNPGLGISSPVHTPTYSRSRLNEHMSFLPTPPSRRISSGSNISFAKEDNKFFRADDVKVPNARNIASRPKMVHLNSAPSPRLQSKKLSTDGKDKSDAKFFHADGQPNAAKDRVPKTTLAMKLSAASRASQSTRSLPAQCNSATSSALCYESDESHESVSLSEKPVTIQSGRNRSVSNTKSAVSSIADRRRSSSLNIYPVLINSQTGHRKSLSTTTADNHERSSEISVTSSIRDTHAPKPYILSGSGERGVTFSTSPPSFLSNGTGISSNVELKPVAPYQSDDTTNTASQRMAIQIRHKRGSSEATAIQPVTKEQLEAAASARRERKVLDLEISNSSLLAINRTLEKELRKQNTELRRFRRLSRSGRLSLNPSNRVVSIASVSTLSTIEQEEMDSSLMSMSPTTTDPDSFHEDDDLESDGETSSTTSSDAIRRRARDEKRLMQDLKRHQRILIDSQKLTQSIQRCLNSTEEMIKDGTKALAYHVELSELQVGGKVLSPDDDEALSEVDFDEYKETMVAPRQGLLSPTVTKDVLEEAAMWANGIQALDGNAESLRLSPQIYLRQPTSPTAELNPVLLPER